jgi:hypothetical protein
MPLKIAIAITGSGDDDQGWGPSYFLVQEDTVDAHGFLALPADELCFTLGVDLDEWITDVNPVAIALGNLANALVANDADLQKGARRVERSEWSFADGRTLFIRLRWN